MKMLKNRLINFLAFNRNDLNRPGAEGVEHSNTYAYSDAGDKVITTPLESQQAANDNDGRPDWFQATHGAEYYNCLLYTSPSPRDATLSRMPSSA